MMIANPTVINANADGTVHCMFPASSPLPTGDYYALGGIWWPGAGIGTTIRPGAIVAGMCHATTRVLWTVNVENFLCVAHITRRGSNHIEHVGCCEFFSKMRTGFGVRRYYNDQPDVISEPLVLEALRCPMIDPNPVFMQPDMHALDALHSLRLMLGVGRLKYQRGSLVHEQLHDLDVGATVTELPAVCALLCMVAAVATLPPT